MDVRGWLSRLEGKWTGTGRLHLSWLPEDQQIVSYETQMFSVVSASGDFAVLTIDWTGAGEPHQGVILLNLGGEGESCDASWVDSWHQAGTIMALSGMKSLEGVSLTGSYAAPPPDPDWGWRIELRLDLADTLTVLMTNISPDGDEEWAVEHIYTKS